MNEYILKAQEINQRFKNLLTGKWAYKLNEIYGFSAQEIELIEIKYLCLKAIKYFYQNLDIFIDPLCLT
jgi:hypothetical protein